MMPPTTPNLDHFCDYGRRNFLRSGAALSASLVVPAWAQNEPASVKNEFWIRPRTLRLQHEKGERIESTFWSDGQYIRTACDEISWFMRDRVVNEAVHMNPILMDINYAICGWLSYFGIKDEPLLMSGHRNRARNTLIEGAAKESLHITGDALDVRVRGISAMQVAKFGVWLGGGGVGWYPSKDFTHLDRGRFRVWTGK